MAQARDTLLRGVVVLCVGVCGVTLASPGHALEVLPGIPLGFDVSLFNGTGALGYSMSGAVSASDFVGSQPVTAADGFSAQDRLFAQPPFGFDTRLVRTLGADAQSGEAEALAQGTISAGFGTLRAAATAAGGGLGRYEAQANVTVSFIDLVQVNAAGEDLELKFDITWKVDGVVSAVPGTGSASARAELWIFPFDILPRPGAQFLGSSYRLSAWTPGKVDDTAIGNFSGPEVVPGARFWVVGALTVGTTSFKRCCAEVEQFFVSSTANFLDTAELFIDPSPGASLTAASGKDYRTPVPVPEPSILVTLGAGLVVIGLIRWRRRDAHGAPS